MRTGRILMLVAVLGLLAGLSQVPASAIEFCSSKVRSYTVAAGETNREDIYGFFPDSVNITGTHQGDLIVCATSVNVSGELTGDLFACAQTVTINGRVGDSIRVFGNTLTITGIIEGDLLVFAENLTLAPGSRITGDVVTFGKMAVINGTVDGDLKASGASAIVNGDIGGDLSGTMGQLSLSGTVGRDCRITCDTLKVDPKARIAGDLEYKAREPVDLEGKGIVGGSIQFDKKEKKAEEPERAFSWFTLWRFLASLVVGFVLIGIFRRMTPSIEASVEREIIPSLGVGFVMAVVLPVAALIVGLLVVTIPLAVIALIAWLIAVYVAKLPVALWLGRRILRALGSADPSPYLGLLIGLVLLFLLFAIPYLGPFLWILTVAVGLGALALGTRGHLAAGPSAGGAAPPPVPSGTTA